MSNSEKSPKLLITGAFSGIGKMVLETALQQGYTVHVFDLPTVRNNLKFSNFVHRHK